MLLSCFIAGGRWNCVYCVSLSAHWDFQVGGGQGTNYNTCKSRPNLEGFTDYLFLQLVYKAEMHRYISCSLHPLPKSQLDQLTIRFGQFLGAMLRDPACAPLSSGQKCIEMVAVVRDPIGLRLLFSAKTSVAQHRLVLQMQSRNGCGRTLVLGSEPEVRAQFL